MELPRSRSQQRRLAIQGVHVHDYEVSKACGVMVCNKCGDHQGLARCFCGWSSSGGDGYQELIEMGEQIEED
ncbi:hypothetical protein LCGC14_1326210 [marine sediment metagenome]|uniref:Uncharacterized protein n=1 Tax=marine sediment metagenome TaxID=412755 RepID=A0A0F9MZ26_9ZZZZ